MKGGAVEITSCRIEVDADPLRAVAVPSKIIDDGVGVILSIGAQLKNDTLPVRAADLSYTIDRAVARSIQIIRIPTIVAAAEAVNDGFAPSSVAFLELKDLASAAQASAKAPLRLPPISVPALAPGFNCVNG